MWLRPPVRLDFGEGEVFGGRRDFRTTIQKSTCKGWEIKDSKRKDLEEGYDASVLRVCDNHPLGHRVWVRHVQQDRKGGEPRDYTRALLLPTISHQGTAGCGLFSDEDTICASERRGG